LEDEIESLSAENDELINLLRQQNEKLEEAKLKSTSAPSVTGPMSDGSDALSQSIDELRGDLKIKEVSRLESKLEERDMEIKRLTQQHKSVIHTLTRVT